MRILWLGDGGCNTGFGRVTHELCQRLEGAGHDVSVLAINYRGEVPVDMEDHRYKLYAPTRMSPDDFYGFTRLSEMLARVRPEAIILLNDLPLIEMYWKAFDEIRVSHPALPIPPIILYVPIDVLAAPAEWAVAANRADYVVCYTVAGAALLDDLGVEGGKLYVAPHGSDGVKFAPASHENPCLIAGYDGIYLDAYDHESIKAALGFEDKFVILWADRLSERKNAGAFFAAVAPVVLAHPDVVVWMHCAPKDIGGQLKDFVSRFGLEGRVFHTPGLDTFEGIPDHQMRTLYNMADLKVSTSMGEGWGLTNVESLLCGTPTIALDTPVNREVLGENAACIPVGYVYTTGRGTDMALPDIAELTLLIENRVASFLVYGSADFRERTSGAAYGREQVRHFTWEDSVDVFLDLLALCDTGELELRGDLV